jgi:long-chain acyl-CoA synthetase
MNLAHLLRHTAGRAPDAPALAIGERIACSYAQLYARTARIAGALRQRFGLHAGDRVALAMANCPQFYEVLFAAWHAGLVAVPINAKLHAREFRYILEHSGSRLCFCTPDLHPVIAALVDECAGLDAAIAIDAESYRHCLQAEPVALIDVEPAAPAWLFYTSGTTGRPKGAILTHRNLQFMVLSYYADIDRLSERDSILHAAPMSHGSGLYGLAFIAQGGCNVIAGSAHFDPEEIFSLLEFWPQVSMFAAPTMLARLVRRSGERARARANLKTIIYGGGPMYLADLDAAIERFGPCLYNLYGQGESPMTITGLSKACHADYAHPRYRERLQSCGVARTAVQVRVVDAEDRDLACGEIGEVLTRSDCVMAGYWNAPQATAAALRGGWLHTGDLGCLDGEGFLTLKDRSKDMIICGGSNIYPREVEEVLLRHGAVAEAAVVGRAHPDWGEEVVAFIVPRPGCVLNEHELDALCLEEIARYKRPRVYRFVGELPKNNYGKVLKSALRDWLSRPASQ